MGGFPCQPMSVAGKRKGTDDDRYLWPEMFRLIKQIKPQFVIGENVQGIINIQNGMVLRQVQDDLESEGFEVQCFLIPASGIGAWHQRYRVWIVAHSQHNGLLAAESRCNEEKNRMEKKYRKENSTTRKSIGASAIRKTDNRHEDVSNTNTRLSIGENEEVQARRDTINDGGKDVPNTNSFGHRGWSSEGCTNERWSFLPREQEGREMGSKTSRCDVDVSNSNIKGLEGHELQSDNEQQRQKTSTDSSTEEQHTWWQAQSSLCGVPNGISYELDKSRANRIKSLGNSIVPLIARELGVAIMKAEQDG